jgi:hypothetical protein
MGMPSVGEVLGYLVLAAGFVVMALGMFEIGGLFAVGAGFVVVLAGCVIVFAGASRADTLDEEAFARQLRDL